MRRRKRLDQVPPAGRIDVLVYRLLEYAAEQICRPEEWAVFEPFAEQFARRFGNGR